MIKKLKKIIEFISNRSIEITEIAIVTYFLRTVFPIYKYFFIATFIISLGLLLTKFNLKFRKISFRGIVVPFLLIGFYILGILNTDQISVFVVKELINALLVISLIIIISNSGLLIYYNSIIKLFNNLLFITGLIAIIRAFLSILGVSVPFSSILFSSSLFTLVSDNNIYALYFLIGVAITAYLFYSSNRKNLFIIYSSIYIINIIFSFSRRGYVIYLFCLVAILLIAIIKWSDKRLFLIIRLHFYIIISISIILFYIVGKYKYEIVNEIKDNKLKYNYIHKLYSLVDPTTSKQNLELHLRNNLDYDFWKDSLQRENLIYNGDFKMGILFWDNEFPAKDIVVYQILEENNTNFIRIDRRNGNGYWQLLYTGRPIYFQKDLIYNLSFDYRVIKGNDVPFYVGWWVKENGNYINNLTYKINHIEGDWNRIQIKYKFLNNHKNPKGFINNQLPETIIDISNINLTCDNSTNYPMFLDQFSDLRKPQLNYSGSNNYLMSSRYERWDYFYYIWNKYTIMQKIFGGGFEYLGEYGIKFYNNSKRLDYPHNPIISSFLYSGIIGGVFYVYFLALVFFYYWKYRKYHFIFFLMYLITFFFCMFSGNSHFSVPIFTFLSIIPFITKYYVENKHYNRLL